MAYPGDVYSSKCSARDALALISGKWVMLILPALAQRPMRNGELLRRIDGISQKVLTQTLRQLERNGLLERLDLSEKNQAHVEYRLSRGGHNLIVAAMDTEDYPCPLPFPFTFSPGELKHYYRDWEILKYNEDVGQLHKTDANGNRISLRFATLLARKL